MRSGTMGSCANGDGSVTRNGADRFAARLHAEQREREEVAALRASLESTCQRDRSAVQAAADKFKIDPATVYRWASGELQCRPLRDFLDLVDTCVAAKGDANPAALALPRLVRDRYLDPHPSERTVSVEFVVGSVAEVMRAAASLVDKALEAISPESPGGQALTLEEWHEIAPLAERMHEAVEAVRVLRPTARRVPVGGGEGRPS